MTTKLRSAICSPFFEDSYFSRYRIWVDLKFQSNFFFEFTTGGASFENPNILKTLEPPYVLLFQKTKNRKWVEFKWLHKIVEWSEFKNRVSLKKSNIKPFQNSAQNSFLTSGFGWIWGTRWSFFVENLRNRRKNRKIWEIDEKTWNRSTSNSFIGS